MTINPEDFARKGDQYMKAREFGQAISAYQTALKGAAGLAGYTIKLGTRTDRDQSMQDKIDSVRNKLGNQA